MSLIPCNCNCAHQSDGYCQLDNAAEVTGQTEKGGCLHFAENRQAKKYGPPKSDPHNQTM